MNLDFENMLYTGGMKKKRQDNSPTESGKRLRKRTKFGERIVDAREAAGLSQKDLADKRGISQRSLSWWERQNVALKPDQLAAIAEALGVSADFLLGRDPEKKRGTGPTGKAKKVFEAVSKLPRHQQKKIIDVVESFVAQHLA